MLLLLHRELRLIELYSLLLYSLEQSTAFLVGKGRLFLLGLLRLEELLLLEHGELALQLQLLLLVLLMMAVEVQVFVHLRGVIVLDLVLKVIEQ